MSQYSTVGDELRGGRCRYTLLTRVGHGTYGVVWEAVHTESGRKSGSLFDDMQSQGTSLFPEEQVRRWISQLLAALAYVHREGYTHRDIKPENVLVRGETAKLADFGLARHRSESGPATEYVSTRWYRSPEILLGASPHAPPMDVFAAGAVLAEALTLRPLFPGRTETDMLDKLCTVLGPPGARTWPRGRELARARGFAFPDTPQRPWAQSLPGCSPQAVDLVARMCCWDPEERLSADEALRHAFFHPVEARAPPRLLPPVDELRRRLQQSIRDLCRVSGVVGAVRADPLKAAGGSKLHVRPAQDASLAARRKGLPGQEETAAQREPRPSWAIPAARAEPPGRHGKPQSG
ncbi:protein kinase [Helicosporidium sp. ATCC 50920]|nr:protein kinase [Helicosporidium sp. ATCC 50920]|eukprot:KDD75950.1 protein kinase [Helicosporidium sp. ATCC 50920]